jgi:quercetin dioxygenase-like cupin family protein
MQAVLLQPGTGERLALGASEVSIKAGGEQTGGSFFLGETVIEPGWPGPPLHRHERLHDMFYVLEGTLTMRVEDATHELGRGSFACVPPGVAHTFSNPSTEPARFLNFNTPSGWEHYMRDLAAQARSGPLTPEAIAHVAAAYDIQVVSE